MRELADKLDLLIKMETVSSLSLLFVVHMVTAGVAPLKPEFSGPKEKIVPIPDGSSFFILGKKNW